MSEAARPINRPWSALIGFMGHAPGLKMMVPCKFTPYLFRANVVAAAATVLAMLIAGLIAPDGEGWWWSFLAWIAGHFAWSVILATWILLGRGITPKDSR